jgi:signal transduction histidine kinase
MDSITDTSLSLETKASLDLATSETAILEFVEKVENLSLFQDRIEKPSRMPQVWDAFREEIERQITPAAVSLFLVDQETHAFELNQCDPDDCEAICRREIDAQIECGTFAWIVNRRQPAVIPALIFKNAQSLVMLPLATHARTLGVAMILTTIEEKAVTHERLRLLGILSKQCALVMENTLLYDQLEKEHQSLQTAQTQIIQAEKFASIGRLTSGAFHELLNPLNIISGHLQLMMMDPDFKAPYPDYLALMKSESDRIATIVNSLLRFSTKQSKDYREIDIIKLLQQMVNEVSASRSIGNVAVDLALEQELPLVISHEDDLKTVVRHLLDNAYDAMLEGGTLHISADLVTSYADTLDDKQFVEIKIADSGSGIVENNIHKVFDPFFTTKGIGEGMGLSLAISYALITSMGGTITFESRTNTGTVFTVALPVNRNGS